MSLTKGTVTLPKSWYFSVAGHNVPVDKIFLAKYWKRMKRRLGQRRG